MNDSRTRVVRVRNVNEALRALRDARPEQDTANWRRVTVRGMETIEYKGTYITEYTHPTERVLFSAARDANPFFHFFESLWILAGRRDVGFLKQFNSKIGDYSDDGLTFHAPYGHRLRHHFKQDQLLGAIELLRSDPTTRRAVMSIWDPDEDLGTVSKDIPCNDMIFFKLRDGVLDMTVANRSNDAIWGAYGANAVQFSTIHEFVAGAVDARVGVYRQVSDSFHIYVGQEAWERVRDAKTEIDDLGYNHLTPFTLWSGVSGPHSWLGRLAVFFNMADGVGDLEDLYGVDDYFGQVVAPMWVAWNLYKNPNLSKKNARINAAKSELQANCLASDWMMAACQWLERRREK